MEGHDTNALSQLPNCRPPLQSAAESAVSVEGMRGDRHTVAVPEEQSRWVNVCFFARLLKFC